MWIKKCQNFQWNNVYLFCCFKTYTITATTTTTPQHWRIISLGLNQFFQLNFMNSKYLKIQRNKIFMFSRIIWDTTIIPFHYFSIVAENKIHFQVSKFNRLISSEKYFLVGVAWNFENCFYSFCFERIIWIHSWPMPGIWYVYLLYCRTE